jgi:bifunctional non-homologous end joining protein LigD
MTSGGRATGAISTLMPVRLEPMLATLGALDALGPDRDWGFEMKWDGVRALVHVEAGSARLVSRNGIDMSVAYPEILSLGRALEGHSAVLDGEIVSFDGQGRPSFGRLQKRMHVADAAAAQRLSRGDPAVVLLFDLLYLDGESLLRERYTRRRERLEALGLAGAAWQTPAAFAGRGAEAVAASQEQQLEGVVAKRLSSVYLPGRRSPDWVKIKNVRAQEVVIGGWKPGNGRRAGMIGALLLGLPSPQGLIYAGKVGTGFTDAMLRDVAADLRPLAQTSSPFVQVPRPDDREVQWVAPRLVGEVAFTEWTDDGRLRHPAWRGLRPDKSPEQVVRES